MLTCTTCSKYLPEDSFTPDTRKSNGRYSQCKDCRSSYKRKIRYEVLTYYSHYDGGMCACCGETEYEFLAIDHINGGGAQHRKERGYSDICSWLRSNGYPDEYQVLCHNCNMAKGMHGSCPHERVKEEVA